MCASATKSMVFTNKFSSTAAKNILIEIAYTGWFEYKKWGAGLRKGTMRGLLLWILLILHKTNSKAKPILG